MILWSIRTCYYKGSVEIKEKRQVRKRALSLKNNTPGLKADFPQKIKKKNDEVDNSQMHCRCYTRYKSNPINKTS